MIGNALENPRTGYWARLSGCVLAIISGTTAAAPPDGQPDLPHYSPDIVLVAFKPGTPAAEKRNAHSLVSGLEQRTIHAIGVSVVQVSEGAVEASIQRYLRNPNVLYAEPNYHRPIVLPTEGSFGANILTLDEQWSLRNTGAPLQLYTDPNTALPGWQMTMAGADISATEAWDIARGDPSIKVAIPDSGVDCTHGDLVGKCLHELDYVTPTADSYGNPIPELTDQLGHGTHVAGTIAMQTDNGVGGAGVGWHTSIGSFKVCYAETFVGVLIGSACQDADVATAIIDATDLGYDIINMSFGQPQPSSVVEDALDYAASRGVILIAGAGNEGSWQKFYPAAYPMVMAVGSTNPYDDRSYFSNFSVDDDDWVDILAPGEPILSSVPPAECGGEPQCFSWKQGTSMAAPHASGTAALILSHLGDTAGALEVRRRMQDCADPVGAMGQNMLAWSRYGRLNAEAALTCDGVAPTPPETVSDSFHVLMLEGSCNGSGPNWSGTVTIHLEDQDHQPVSNITVMGSWDSTPPGTQSSCTTGASGQCSVTIGELRKRISSVNFWVDDIVDAADRHIYSATDNHVAEVSQTLHKP